MKQITLVENSPRIFTGVRATENVIVIIPTHSNDSQGQATRYFDVISGPKVRQIINKLTTSQIGFVLYKKSSNVGKKNVLNCDLGGGTLAVSIEEGMSEVKVRADDTELAGKYLDNWIVNPYVQEFKERTRKTLVVAFRRLEALNIESASQITKKG